MRIDFYLWSKYDKSKTECIASPDWTKYNSEIYQVMQLKEFSFSRIARLGVDCLSMHWSACVGKQEYVFIEGKLVMVS